jgi:hypothetical protein
VSIINRLRLSAHLDEAALVSLWTDATLAAKAAAHPHLERCPSCRNRFAELGSWLATMSRRCGVGSRRAFLRRTPRGAERADLPAPGGRGAAGARDCVSDVHPATDLAFVECVTVGGRGGWQPG